jgi:hypothetical protein
LAAFQIGACCPCGAIAAASGACAGFRRDVGRQRSGECTGDDPRHREHQTTAREIDSPGVERGIDPSAGARGGYASGGDG